MGWFVELCIEKRCVITSYEILPLPSSFFRKPVIVEKFKTIFNEEKHSHGLHGLFCRHVHMNSHEILAVVGMVGVSSRSSLKNECNHLL